MQQGNTWLVANWKMNGSAAEVCDFAVRVNACLAMLPAAVNAVFCPPSLYIGNAQLALPANARLGLGAQDCHAEKSGAHTGEIGAGMLKDIGCRYVIIGHSERRAAGETDAQILAKANAALASGLTAILCVGETEAEYTARKTNAVLDAQLKQFKDLPPGGYLIAYEPVWAIGTGKTPTPEEIEAAHAHVKSVLGSGVSVLYGGSVKAGNAREILGVPGVSGALVGSASLDAKTMQEIINAARGRE